MEKLTLAELGKNKSWREAVVVFAKESWDREYSLESRSYQVSSINKYFDPNMIGSSLFGNCLDGMDNGVRLDIYMKLLPKEGKRWKVDYCYIIR